MPGGLRLMNEETCEPWSAPSKRATRSFSARAAIGTIFGRHSGSLGQFAFQHSRDTHSTHCARHARKLFPQRAGMHPPEVKQAALELMEAGVNDCEVARRLGVPRSTVKEWRAPRYVARRQYQVETCARCWRAAKPMRFTDEDYSELLAM